jgi:large subunit ribosomal protein L4
VPDDHGRGTGCHRRDDGHGRPVTLDDTVFGVQPNVPVMHQVVTAQLAAARSGTQSTKTRAEVSGGGKKPFKQKGTGRARQGSERAPHFAGGGVAFGPKPRSYKQRTPRKMIQLALRSALSDRAAEGRVAVVAPWPWEQPSTKSALRALSALALEGRLLVVLGREDSEAYRSFRNIPDIQVILAGELNTYDVLCNDWVVFTTETLPGIAEVSEVSEGAVAEAEGQDDAAAAMGSEDATGSEDAMGSDDEESGEAAADEAGDAEPEEETE